MSALQEWYRYVDSLVRPSRRFEELEEWWVPDDAAEDEGESERASEREREANWSPRSTAADTLARSLPPSLASSAPPPPPVDPRAVVARLSVQDGVSEPPVEWEAIGAECKVPDLGEFIPDLGAVPAPGTAAQAFLEAITRFQPRPRDVEPEFREPPALPTSDRVQAPALPLPAVAPSRETDRDARERSSEDAAALSAPSAPPVTTAPPAAPATDPAAMETSSAPAIPEPREEREPPPVPAAPPKERASRSRPAVRSTPAAATLPRPAAMAGCDLPTIASIREGLPRIMERLLQIPITEEVAQNSYKLAFRETREELIQRLFDPPLTLEDTARLLGVCPTTVRRYTNKGLLRHYRTQGNQRRFRLSDLLAFLERWGDAGPEAGALGGSASSGKAESGSVRGGRKSRAKGSTDAEKTQPTTATSDA